MALEVCIKKQCNRFELNVNFKHDKGILGVLGASGCGKSMTLKCIAGIEQPDEGHIVLDGGVLFDSAKKINLPPQQRRVGYLFQNYALFPHMTVQQNILAGVKADSATKREAVLQKYRHMFYLDDLQQAYPGALSGGQQQRVALARIFASEPQILMLDEPFSALDDYLKWQVELQLADVLKLYKGNILFVSHSGDEIYRFCDDIIVLSEGKIAADTSKHELFETPQTLAASKLSGCKNHARLEFPTKDTAIAKDWDITLHLDNKADRQRDVYAGIRAHDIQFTDEEHKDEENVFIFTAERIIDNLFSYIVMLRHDKAAEALRLECAKDELPHGLKQGDAVYAKLPKEHIFLVKA